MGQQLEVLQLHACDGASLTALPCAQLQDLLLHGSLPRGLSISSSVWADIAAATKLTSVSLKYMGTAPQQADVVSVLTALPDLQQLTWCNFQLQLSDSSLLELAGGVLGPVPMSSLCKCTQLRVLMLRGFTLRGPGSLVASTMLQDMELSCCRIIAADGAAGPVSWQQVFPGPAQLPHLTSLQLSEESPELQETDIKHVVSCCSSLQHLYLTPSRAAVRVL